MERAFALVLVVCLSSFLSCRKPNEHARDEVYLTKMRLVVEEAIRQTQDAAEKEELRSGNVFVDLKDLGMPVVGVSVPVGKSKIHVSFMLDYFQSRDVPVLASDALRDFRRAAAQQKEKH